MQAVIHVLTDTRSVQIIAILLLFSAFFLYVFWFRPAVKSTLIAMNQITFAVMQDTKEWSFSKERAKVVVKANAWLAPSWLETQDRVFEIEVKGQKRTLMFGSPRDLWNSNALLKQRFNLVLADAVPNVLVGVGLFFTFLFLTVALTEATQALGPQSDTEETKKAISNLLTAAGGKFLTSLAGLFASLAWSVASKKKIKILSFACQKFLDELSKIVPVNGAEVLMLKQGETASDSLALTEELLTEVREQTGTFKRFETDLAVTLAGAINKSFTPQMELMTSKLVKAIDGLSEKLGTMNQEALQTMLEDFSVMLQKTTKTEMAQLQTTLADLTEKLKSVGGVIGQGGDKFKDDLNAAGAELVERVHEISENLANGAANLDTAAGAVKVAMNDLEVTMVEASTLGKRGALFVHDALEKTGKTIQGFDQIASGLSTASSAFQGVAGKISEVVDNIEELSREQRGVVEAVRIVAPTAQAAVERVASVLETTGQHTKDSMEATAATLTKTVASITAGVSSYSDQIAELHRKMDHNLAKAVGSFQTNVSELSEAVEELSEIMQSKKG